MFKDALSPSYFPQPVTICVRSYVEKKKNHIAVNFFKSLMAYQLKNYMYSSSSDLLPFLIMK